MNYFKSILGKSDGRSITSDTTPIPSQYVIILIPKDPKLKNRLYLKQFSYKQQEHLIETTIQTFHRTQTATRKTI